MNFRELLKGKNASDVMDIAENWYARLNKIKAAYAVPGASGIPGYQVAQYTSNKAARIAEKLAERLRSLSIIYNKATMGKMPKGEYPSGMPPNNQ